jgi:hypothetical protein
MRVLARLHGRGDIRRSAASLGIVLATMKESRNIMLAAMVSSTNGQAQRIDLVLKRRIEGSGMLRQHHLVNLRPARQQCPDDRSSRAAADIRASASQPDAMMYSAGAFSGERAHNGHLQQHNQSAARQDGSPRREAAPTESEVARLFPRNREPASGKLVRAYDDKDGVTAPAASGIGRAGIVPSQASRCTWRVRAISV